MTFSLEIESGFLHVMKSYLIYDLNVVYIVEALIMLLNSKAYYKYMSPISSMREYVYTFFSLSINSSYVRGLIS